jgi:hypothetical protein
MGLRDPPFRHQPKHRVQIEGRIMPGIRPLFRFIKTSYAVLALGAALGSAAPSFAQAVQPWPDGTISGPIGGGFLGSGELIGRVADEERASQIEGRLQVGHALSKSVTAWIGWVHVATYVPTGLDTREDQVVEQLNWNIGTAGRFKLSTRTRVEQRFISRVDDTNWRWRQQVRLAVALGGKDRPSAIVWAEPFIALNTTAAQTRTLDQLRIFAGIGLPVSRHLDVEMGYLNQRIYRASGKLVNHAVPIVATLHF